ncbi:helix-turn-helix domain-containing protein (plasmid) [Ralstonia syzygii subsp. celebesensis]|uniref:helix-turn-helix domain-containing protein n=1 Tax=Ralstonia syzygii TaxID=28097 RepID=UPI001FF75382
MSQTTENQTVGDRIKAVRGDRGISEFAAELGVNRKTVTRWEADEALPDGGSLLVLKTRFGADPGWILTGEGDSPDASTLTPEEQLLLSRYRSSPAELRDAALRVLLGGGNEKPKKFAGSMQVFHQAPTGDIAGRDIKKKR